MSKVAEEAQQLLEAGDLKGAMKVVNAGLNKDPDDMAALMIASCIVSRDHCWGLAYNMLKRVAEKSPPFPEIYNNLGMAASSLASSSGKDSFMDEAETVLRKAYRKHPIAPVVANLALVMVHKGQAEAAERLAREALEMDPDNISARETLGFALLHQWKWDEGFKSYELGTIGGKYRVPPKGKYWERGQRGKILLRGEQGLGDEINYASILPQASQDSRITYECDKRLEGLMKRSLPNVDVRGTRFEDPKHLDGKDFDAVGLTGSLCMEYRKKDEDFPRKGFLIADAERCLQWRTLLDTLPGKKVGIAWTGGLDNTFKTRRSFNLETLLPILKTPGITWVSLQYKDPTEEIAALRKHGVEIRHWARAVEKGVDYDETAALVSELDDVVTATTSVACLAGALGKRAHVLVPRKTQWFYASQAGSHAWYESLRLHRQRGEWSDVIESVRREL